MLGRGVGEGATVGRGQGRVPSCSHPAGLGTRSEVCVRVPKGDPVPGCCLRVTVCGPRRSVVGEGKVRRYRHGGKRAESNPEGESGPARPHLPRNGQQRFKPPARAPTFPSRRNMQMSARPSCPRELGAPLRGRSGNFGAMTSRQGRSRVSTSAPGGRPFPVSVQMPGPQLSACLRGGTSTRVPAQPPRPGPQRRPFLRPSSRRCMPIPPLGAVSGRPLSTGGHPH